MKINILDRNPDITSELSPSFFSLPFASSRGTEKKSEQINNKLCKISTKLIKNKIKIFLLLSLLILPIIFSESQTINKLISVDKDQYALGEAVSISIQDINLSSFELDISSKEKIYRYLEIKEPNISFIPQSIGTYEIQLIDKNNFEKLDNVSFEVVENNNVQFDNNSLIFNLGENIELIRKPIEKGADVIVNYGNRTYKYYNLTEPTLIFNPKEGGNYSVAVSLNGNVIDEYNFTVLPPISKPEISAPKAVPQLKYSSNIPEIKIRHTISEKIGIESVEEKTKKHSGKYAEKGFSIEAHILTLNDEEISASAYIEETETGILTVKPELPRNIRAGFYKLRINITEDNNSEIIEQEFPYGLISLNTKKSIYTPGELAEFDIVALDENGRPVEDANLSLSITSPNNELSFFSTDSNTILKTSERGVYYAFYPTSIEGNYSVLITSHLNDKEINFSTYFLVKQNYEFDIIRNANSKIDPTKENSFDVTIDVEPYVNADDLIIKEYVPSSFDVKTSAQVTIEGDAKVLTWNIPGSERTIISYSYSVPMEWPKLYTLGPLEIDYNENKFYEARPWYVAVDPDFNPNSYNLLNGTRFNNGTVSDVSSSNNAYMSFESYAINFSNTVSTAAIVYRSNTGGSGTSSPKYRAWNGAAWDAAETEMATAGSAIQAVRLVHNPLSYRYYEKITVTQSADGGLDAYVWNGTGWWVTNNIATVGALANAVRRFDIAYETKSGRAMLVYASTSASASEDLAYKIWNGTEWSAPAAIDDTNQLADVQYNFVVLASNPLSNELALIGTYAAGSPAPAWIWDGSQWGNMANITTALQIATEESVQVAYEQSSGELLAVAGQGTLVSYRTWTAAGWNVATTTDINPSAAANTNWLKLKPEPGTNRMMIVGIDAGVDLSVALWDGGVWGGAVRRDGTVDGADATRSADFDWEPAGVNGILVWGNTAGVFTYRNFTGTSWNATDTNPPAGANEHYWVQLERNPRNIAGDRKVLGADLETTANDIDALIWNVNTLTVTDNQFTADTATSTFESFDIDYNKFGAPNQFRLDVEYTVATDTSDWSYLNWSVESSWDIASANVTYQLYNYTSAQYVTSGNGYLSYISSATAGTDQVYNQSIQSNWQDLRDASGNMRLRITGIKSASTEFNGHIDNILFKFHDRLPPNVTLNAPLNNSNLSQTDVSFNFTPADNIGLQNATLWINISGTFAPYQDNQSEVINRQPNYITVTNIPEGRYIWNVKVYDTYNNSNFSNVNYTVMIDRTTPSDSNIKSYPASPATYSSSTRYQFNVTWSDSLTAIHTVLIEHDFNGTLLNYTVTTKNGAEYNYTYPGQLAGGTYQWREYANDSVGNVKATAVQYYTVNKAGTTTYLYLNGSRANKIVNLSRAVNFTVQIQSISKVVNLTSNYPDFISQNGNSPLQNTNIFNVLGTFTFNGSFGGDVNYSESFEAWNVTVIDSIPPAWSSSQKNATIVYQDDWVNFNATWMDNYNLSGYMFSTNESGDWINASFVEFSGTLNYSYNITQVTTPEARIFFWKFYANDSSGNWNETDLQSFAVADTNPPEVSLLGPNDNTYSNYEILEFNFSARDSSALKNATLYANFSGTWLSNATNTTNLVQDQLTTINATGVQEGYYIWNILVCDNASYPGPNCGFASTNRTIIVDRTIPTWGNNQTNETADAPKQGNIIQLNVTISDTVSLQYYVYSTNDSGTWQNSSPVTISSTSYNITINETVNSPTDRIIGWLIFFYDTAGNLNQTTLFTYLVKPGGGDYSPPDITLNSPEDYVNLSLYNITFNISAYDFSNLLNATLYLNSSGTWKANQTINESLQNNVPFYFNITDIEETSFVWNVLACDNSTFGESNCGFTAQNRTVTIDRIKPRSRLNYTTPESNAIYHYDNNYTFHLVWEDYYLKNITIEHNFTGQFVNYTVEVPSNPGYSIYYNYTYTNLKPGEYVWRENAWDYAGNFNTSKDFTYIVLKAPPAVVLYLEGERANRTYNIYTIATFQVDVLNFTGRQVNLTSNLPGFAAQNGTQPLTNLTNLTSIGLFWVNGSFEGNENFTYGYELWFVNVTDLDAPTWSNPQFNRTTVYQNDWIKFNTTWRDNYNLSGYKFSSNQSGNWINSSFVSFYGTLNYSYNITRNTLLAGQTLYWKFYANDSFNRWNETDVQSFVVADNTPPTLTLQRPINNSNISSNSITFNFTPSDNLLLKNATLYANFSGTWQANESISSLTNGTNNSITVSQVPEGEFVWNVLVYDTYDNSNFSSRNFTLTVDRTSPFISLMTPTNDTYTNNQTAKMFYVPADLHLKNCSLYATFSGIWRLNQTNYAPTSDATNNFSDKVLPEGLYSWNVQCFDHASNVGWNSTNFTLTMDTTAPNVTLISPPNNTLQTATTTVTFQYNVTDINPISNCSLILNNEIRDTLPSIERNTTQSFTSSLGNGIYNWSINCTDLASNTGTSVKRNLTLNVPIPPTGSLITYYTSTNTNYPKYREGNGTVWNNEKMASTLQTDLKWAVLDAAPLREEDVLATIDSNNYVKVQIWDGVNWSSATTLTTTGNSTYRGLAVAYEQNTSRALIVYNNKTSTPRYNIWNGTSLVYSDGQSMIADGCTGEPVWIVLAAKRNSSEIMEVDLDTNGDFCAQIWNGNSWGNAKTLYDGTGFATQKFDAAYEDSTRGGLVVFDYSGTAGQIWYANWTGSAWQGAAYTGSDPGGANLWIKTAAMRGSDRIMVGTIESAASNDINALEWSGSAWGTVAGVDTSSTNNADRDMDVAYIGTSGQAMIVYDDGSASNRVAYRTCTSAANCFAGTWVAAAFTSGVGTNCGEAADIDYAQLDPDRNSNRVLLTAASQTTHYKCSQEYSGTAWDVWNSNLGSGAVDVSKEDFMAKYNRRSPDYIDPTVELNYPGDGSWINNANPISFNYTPSDNLKVKNATLYTNSSGTWNANVTQIGGIINGSVNTLYSSMPEGTIVWNVYVQDTSGNDNFALQNFTVTIDRTQPSIILLAPVVDYNTTNTSIRFSWNATDNLDSLLNCNITLDGTVNRSNLNSEHGNESNITINTIPTGVHLWNVTCLDNAGNTNTSLTRNFTVVGGPESLTAELHYDNQSINLSWSAVSYANYYNVYISLNPYQFESTPNVTGITNLNWTDFNASFNKQRYYKVSTVKGGAEKQSNKTVGKYEISLDSYWNLIGTSLNLTHKQLGEDAVVGNPLPVKPANAVLSIYRLNATNQKWEQTEHTIGYGWTPVTGSEDFTTFDAGTGYWFYANDTLCANLACNLTFVGEVLQVNFTYPIYLNWSITSWHPITNPTLPTSEPPYYPITVNPIDSVIRMYRYNVTTDLFEKTDHYAGYGWYPASGASKSFLTMETTKGYYFKVNPNANWTQEVK